MAYRVMNIVTKQWICTENGEPIEFSYQYQVEQYLGTLSAERLFQVVVMHKNYWSNRYEVVEYL